MDGFEEELEDQQNGEEGQEPNSIATAAEPKQKKVRGETTLASYIGKSKPKEKVNFDDSGKVNGDNQTRFSDTIGVLLKQSRRFVWHDHWDVQPNEAKDRLWAELEDVFILDDCQKKDALSIAGAIFRSKKSHWKSEGYKLSNTHAQNLASKPDALTEGQWKGLVNHWDDKETQKRAAENAEHRKQQKVKHTMGRKNVARCVAELAEENGGNPPTEGDVFIKTHVNKDSKKALDPTSQGFIDQMREQSGLDLNGLDEDGKQQPISDEVFVNVVPTCRKKRVRAERQNLTYSSSGRNEDYEREKKEREEEFNRLLSAQNAAWESRLKAQLDEYNRSHHQMLEYVRLVRPEIFTIPRQLSGPSDHLFMNYRLGGQPHRNLEQPCGPLERPYRSEEQLFQPEEQAYRPGDQLNRSQNDSGTHGAGTHGAGLHVLDWFNL